MISSYIYIYNHSLKIKEKLYTNEMISLLFLYKEFLAGYLILQDA